MYNRYIIFSTTESEFRTQFHNHKNSFTYCIDEKATELTNKFGT